MDRIWRRLASTAGMALAALALAPAAGAAIFTVTTTADENDGVCTAPDPCSLREAIDAANAAAGADVIAFSIGTGAQTLALTSALPNVTGPTVIDATTQPGFAGAPIVELSGAGAVSAGPIVGLRLTGGSSTIKGLVVTGFSTLGSSAIELASSGNVVEGNYVGTDLTGTTANGNYFGMEISIGADNNVVGGATAAARNVISGSTSHAITLLGAGTGGNLIEGNYIGLNAAGTARIDNGGYGILIQGTDANTIRGNVLSGNRSGVTIGAGGVTTAGQTVEQNLMGWNAAQTAILGQLGAGVVISNSSGSTFTGNAIAGHSDVGLLIDPFGGTATGNAIRSTTFRGNNGLGIDFVDPGAVRGVTANDAGDADTGANNLQNFPVLTSATVGGGGTQIAGTLNSAANATFAVDFFSSATCNSANDREGEAYLGTTTVTTNASGDGAFSHNVATVVATTDQITATATDAAGNTSEFSACQTVAAASSTLTVNSANDADDGACNATHCSLREAITAANAAAGANTIEFAIAGAGPHTIPVASSLPTVSGPATIDATTQSGYAGQPLVRLDDAASVSIGLATSGNVTVRGLSITGFGNGLNLDGGGNVAEANWIGLDATGAADGNTNLGISLGGANNRVGGTTTAQRNVVSGNPLNGIIVGSGFTPAADTGNVVAGNLIGLSPDGSAARPNGNGVLVNSNGNTIERNTVSGNSSTGVLVGGNNNVVRSNLVGPTLSGGALTGSNGIGIRLYGDAIGNTIGGTDASAGNTVKSNAAAGISVTSATSTQNTITANAVDSNGGLGIDLGGDGVTANDGSGDPDSGANGLQNTPVLSGATISGGSTRISGSLLTGATASYRVDFYASATCDPSGSGEGARWIGYGIYSTNADGFVAIDTGTGITGPVTSGDAVTATATAPNGSTSEFSACVTASGGGTVAAMTSPDQCPSPGFDGTKVTFEEGIIEGTVAERYAGLGLHFLDDAIRTPFLNTDRIGGAPTQSPPTSLFNSSEPTINPAASLSMTFDEPQTAVGMYIGNNQYGFNPTATLTAYSAEGAVLGSVSVPVALNDVTQFFGITRSLGGIRKVELNYGETSLGEEIDDLCFTALGTDDGEGEPTGVELTSDRRVLPVAAQVVPLSSVPGSQLPAFSGSPGTGPVGSLGSSPIGSVPIGSVPIGSVPIGSVPIGSVPIGSVPIGSVPIGSVGLSGVPIGSVGLDGILLSDLPVDWGALLGTDVPVQTLTLADVYANATWRAKFEALTLSQSGLATSVVGSLTFPAILLGNLKLAQIPPPGASTWCDAIQNAGGSCAGVNTSTNTVAGLGIAGIPIGSVPIGSVPIGSVPIGSVPIGSVPIASVDLAASRLAGIRLSAITNANAVVDCSRVNCSTETLGDAGAKSPSAIRPDATLSQLAGALGNITINDIIIGILPRSALAWESFPLDGLQVYAGTGDEIAYTLSFDLSCPVGTGFAAAVRLPTGYIVKSGSTRVRYGLASAVVAPDPVTSAKGGARWTSLPGDPCPSGVTTRRVSIDFKALGGYTLGVHDSSATVTTGGTTRSATDQAPVLTRQNWEPNEDPATATVLDVDKLAIVHVASSGDDEVFRVAIPTTPGTRTTFLLSHIEEGADFDLVVQQPASTTLQSSPIASVPIGSVPVEDTGSGLSEAGTTIPPETLQDIPIGSVPIGSVPIASVSANRGNADEVAEVVATGESGFYTVTIRGYNGSHSDLPAVLRVKRTPPPSLACDARSFPNAAGTPGTLPGSLPATTKTLFLVNRTRLNALYGQAPTNAMIAQAQALLGRAEVAGAILEVDGNAAVRSAYSAWDADPCKPELANAAVRAINDVVAGYRGGLPSLRHIVLLGTDEALPMARISDPTTISNEVDEAADLLFTTKGTPKGSALHAAAARGKFLSDAPYGTLASIPWLGRQLYLPELAVGRLVETPLDIERQLKLYADAEGMLNASSALTTGYDFLRDGAAAVDSSLTALAGGNAQRLLDDTWTAATLTPLLTTTPVPAVNSVNAHYSHWLLQPAAGSTLVSTGSLPALPADPLVEPAFARRILFTMGCHGGLNVADTLLPGSTAPSLRDWAQAYGQQRAAVYVANTGFGYGDTESNALSERLMSLFAARLREARPIGEAWTAALGDYFLGAGAYGVYDEKVLEEATFYGLPFWRISGAAAPVTPTPPALAPDAVSGLEVASLSVAPALTDHTTSRGRFWSGPNGTVDVHYRPIQPRYERDVTVPGKTAHGVIIKALSTNDVAGVDPATSLPTIDLSAHEEERDFRDTVFPASIVNLTRARGPLPNGTLGERQSLVVTAGQYRPSEPPSTSGIERLVLSTSVEIAYSTSTDFSPPGIELVGSTFAGSTATIVVETTEPVRRVAAIFNDTLSWRFVELANAGGNRWTASVSANHAIEVAAMAQDTAGNVGYSTNKGFNFMSVADTGGPEILIESPGPLQRFALGSQVRADYVCSDPAGVASCAGPVPSGGLLDTSRGGTYSFTVNASDTGGRTSTETRQYLVLHAFSGFLAPIDNPPILNVGTAGKTYPVKWQLKDGSGGYVRSLAVVRKVVVTRIDCANLPTDTIEETAAGSVSGLTYDTKTEQFVYTWKTEKSWVGTCRRLTFELDDGTKPYADFSFK